MESPKKNILPVVIIVTIIGVVAVIFSRGIFKSSASQEKKMTQTTTPAPKVSPEKSKSEASPQKSSTSMAANTLARVGDWTITIEEFNERLKALKEVLPEQDMQSLETQGLILEELIRQQLLVEEAEKTGLDKEKNIMAALEEFRRTLLVRELAAKLTEKITVSEDEMKNFYEQNKDLLVNPAQWRLSEIVVSEQAKANEILIELLKGGDFAQLAQQNSIGKTAQQGGDLGVLQQPPFPGMASAAAPLGEGEVSSVFKGPEGYYIVKVIEKKGGEPIPFDDIKEEIRQNQLLTKQQEVILTHIDELQKEIPVEVNKNLLESQKNNIPEELKKKEEDRQPASSQSQ